MKSTVRTDQPSLPLGMRLLPADRTRYADPVFLSPEGDIVCPFTVGSAFGGPFDTGDSGGTASGLRTDGDGGIVGCSLPMPAAKGCHGTPLAQLPWRTLVEVTCNGVTAKIPLIDDGPSGGLDPCRMIDFTTQAWCVLLRREVHAREVNIIMHPVSFRIRGVGRFMVDYRPQGVTRP